jgi:hypothetical protein
MKHYVMKTYGGMDIYIHVFLTWALVGGEWIKFLLLLLGIPFLWLRPERRYHS